MSQWVPNSTPNLGPLPEDWAVKGWTGRERGKRELFLALYTQPLSTKRNVQKVPFLIRPPTMNRKGFIVATGLLLFVIATYKYLPTSSETPFQNLYMTNQTALPKLPSLTSYTGGLKKAVSTLKGNSNVHVWKENLDRPPNIEAQTRFAEGCNHFEDWPSSTKKQGCPLSYNQLSDQTVSVVIYMKDDVDSLPVQTFLSSVQFIRESSRRLIISNVVLVFVNTAQSYEAHISHADYITSLAGSFLSVITTSADTEWKAKLAGVQLSNSEQVLMLDDTVIAGRGFALPLISALETRPDVLVCPHVDSLLPIRIYTIYSDKKLHPDGQIWQETSIQTYYVAANMSMMRYPRDRIQKLPTMLPSGGLTGEAFAGRRGFLISLMSKMKTDEVAELSLLSYLCGEGVFITKCSTVVRADNYEMSTPEVKDPEQLQRLYPLYDNNPNKEKPEGCQDTKRYFSEISRLYSL